MKVDTPVFSLSGVTEVTPEASQGPEEGGQFENHCKIESLRKAGVFGNYQVSIF